MSTASLRYQPNRVERRVRRGRVADVALPTELQHRDVAVHMMRVLVSKAPVVLPLSPWV